MSKRIRKKSDKQIIYIPFGKYKYVRVTNMKTKEQVDYLRWLIKASSLDPRLKGAIQNQILNYNYNSALRQHRIKSVSRNNHLPAEIQDAH